MNLEQRLQHAARELREVTIDVPPLGGPIGRSSARRRPGLIPALAAPLLFAAGALFAVGAVRGVEQPMHSDFGVVGAVVQPTDESTGPPASPPDTPAAPDDDASVTAPSIHEELQMISVFLAESRADEPDVDDGPVIDEPAPESPDAVGPI